MALQRLTVFFIIKNFCHLTHGTIALIILAIHGTIALIIHPGKRGEIDVYSFQDASFLYV